MGMSVSTDEFCDVGDGKGGLLVEVSQEQTPYAKGRAELGEKHVNVYQGVHPQERGALCFLRQVSNLLTP